MMNFIKNFRKDEDGAVTVDWVVLTAAIVGLAAVAYGSISDGVDGLSEGIATDLRSHSTNSTNSTTP
ncbi:Flp family type IVb pilin [Sulfitobacter sp. 1A13421]|uniref:Flp family type IVb pilin n=1 Tax=Sulfitobacter sp. 1A13421 TaxID=3368595 RepID=UPI003746BE4D